MGHTMCARYMFVDSRLRPGVPGPLLSQLEHLEPETEAPAPEKTLNHLKSWCRPKSTARKSSEPEDAAATALSQAPEPGLERLQPQLSFQLGS